MEERMIGSEKGERAGQPFNDVNEKLQIRFGFYCRRVFSRIVLLKNNFSSKYHFLCTRLYNRGSASGRITCENPG